MNSKDVSGLIDHVVASSLYPATQRGQWPAGVFFPYASVVALTRAAVRAANPAIPPPFETLEPLASHPSIQETDNAEAEEDSA